MDKVYVVGTCDTKEEELLFVRDTIARAGVPALLVDVGTRGRGSRSDIGPEVVARHHPDGTQAVLGLDDRGRAVEGMGHALERFLASRGDLAGVIGLGGGGNTSMVTRAMRALPIGLPKLMVSTVAGGNVAPYVGLSDVCMMPPVTDVAGLNSLNRVILGNAAHAIAGMCQARHLPQESNLVPIGITQFGVTTTCVDGLRAALGREFECMVFHATGVGGQTMEKLVDSGLLQGLLDVTTTEVADFLVGGVLPCTEDRFGAIARTRKPCVVSCGALDMVNFGPADTVPVKFRARRLYPHNPQVTLMRTSTEESARMGEWIAQRLNACEGSVTLVVPEGGVSALDAPGQAFWDRAADRALFDALERTLNASSRRKLVFSPHHINSPGFGDALIGCFREVMLQGDLEH